MTPTPALCFLYCLCSCWICDCREWLCLLPFWMLIMAVSKTHLYLEFHFIFSCIDFCSKVISELLCKAFKLVHWVSAFSQFWKFVKFTTNIIFIMNKLVHVLMFLACIWELCCYDICQDADYPDMKFSFLFSFFPILFVCVCFFSPTSSKQIVW